MTAALQCQREAARFASTPATVDDLRARAVRSALRRLRDGDRDGALAAMYDGLAAQAPLTFKRPGAVR